MPYIIYNGKILDDQTALVCADNRGLRYGDGVFETLKSADGRLILADEHLPRLWKGMKELQFQIPVLFSPELLIKETQKLLLKNKHTYARVRWTIFRGNGGLYDVASHQPNYIIQTWQIPQPQEQLNSNGLHICLYDEARKPCDKFANLKHNNYLPYLMGAIFAKQQQCNDAIILNQHGRICDSTIANLFLITGKKILTPALQEGCVAGIMRAFVIAACRNAGFEVDETAISPDMLTEADEIFLTNSIYNIRWVSRYEDKTFTCTKTQEIYRQIRQTNPSVFC